jgi:hypothetical protein
VLSQRLRGGFVEFGWEDSIFSEEGECFARCDLNEAREGHRGGLRLG